MKGKLLVIIASLAASIGLLAVKASALETTYWVWHRSAPLSASEARTLAGQDVHKLYWHVGTLRAEGGGWLVAGRLEVPAKTDSAIQIIPVLRLSAEGAMPLGEVAVTSVLKVLAEVVERTQAGEVQLDFDCPDRRLPEYAALLLQCRNRLAPVRLSATALAGWSKAPGFEQLQAGVDLLMPMFYDLEPDSAAEVRAGRVRPLVDAAAIASQIESWQKCRVPWFAGVANFARLTVFDTQGASRGHLRAWDWDEVCFNPSLVLQAQPGPGVTLLRSTAATVLANTALAAGETLACRWPELSHFARALDAAQKAGATGVAIFRLPGDGSQGGWSLPQLGTVLKTRDAGAPGFALRQVANGLELRNLSGSDLAPRLAGAAGPRDRGWELEVESVADIAFREATPGEFAGVFGHVDPDAAQPKPVPVPLARRLTYWFGALRAGQSRQTGLLQLAPGVAPSSLRWRIPHSPLNSEWKPLE